VNAYDPPKWEPARGPDDEGSEPLLGEAVGQALGAASACWDNLSGAGVFDSTRCGEIHEWLMAYLSDWADKIREDANKATTAKIEVDRPRRCARPPGWGHDEMTGNELIPLPASAEDLTRLAERVKAVEQQLADMDAKRIGSTAWLLAELRTITMMSPNEGMLMLGWALARYDERHGERRG
jgi:hypothetical protein